MNTVTRLFSRTLKCPVAETPIAWIGRNSRPLILLGVALLAAINFLSYDTIHLEGDGTEYLLMSVSFERHYSPALTAGDIQDAEARLEPYHQQLNPRVNIKALNQGEFKLGDPNSGCLFYKSRYGSYFSGHFWLYSLVNVPCLLLTHILRLSPARSFFMLNSLIAMSTIAFIIYARGLGGLKRYCLILFYITSGTTYYLHWSHPEVFSASLLLISLILMERGDFVPASFLLALSAQQNPPIGVVAALSLLLGFYFNVIKGNRNGRRVLNGLLLVFAAMVLVLSPAFNYVHFGVPSVIAKYLTDARYISFLRLQSFYFDPNQGMIRAIPFLFVLTPIAFLSNCLNKQWRVILSAAGLIIISIALAIPSLSERDCNSGCQVVMRYAYWASMPIGLAFALLLVALPGFWKYIFISIMAAGQALCVLEYRVDGDSCDHLHYSSVAEWLLNNHAWCYNPPAQLLMRRGAHIDSYNDPIYYYVFDNKVTKIAYLKGNEDTVMPWSLSIAATKSLPGSSTVENEDGWFYINPRNVIRTHGANGLHPWSGIIGSYHGQVLGFGPNDNGVRYLGEGWSSPEEWGLNSRVWGIWSKSVESDLFLAHDNVGDIPFLFKFTGKPFINDKRPEQHIDVFVNGHHVSTVIYHSMETQTTSISIPSDIINDSKFVNIRFEIKSAWAPIESGLSDDLRQLGIFLIDFQFCPDPKHAFPQLDFGPAGNSAPFLESGWSTPDSSGGTWSVGLESFLHIDLPHAVDRDMILRINAGAFAPSPQYPEQTAEIIVNDYSLGKLTYSSLTPKIDSLILPASIFKNGATRLTIAFKVKYAVSPLELGLSTDARKLGLCLISLSLEPVKN